LLVLGWKYESAIDTALIGSSNQFEVAIAVAVTLYGIGSGSGVGYCNRSFDLGATDDFFSETWAVNSEMFPKKETRKYGQQALLYIF
jgi:hypothetical protein